MVSKGYRLLKKDDGNTLGRRLLEVRQEIASLTEFALLLGGVCMQGM